MNAQLNAVLEQIRAKLADVALVEADAETASTSPDTETDSVAGKSTPGTSGATNISDVEDTLDMYLSGLVDRLMHRYDVTDEEAADVVFACIDKLVADGKLAELPEEGSDEAAVAAWVGRATTSGLPKHLDDFARELEVEGSDEED